MKPKHITILITAFNFTTVLFAPTGCKDKPIDDATSQDPRLSSTQPTAASGSTPSDFQASPGTSPTTDLSNAKKTFDCSASGIATFSDMLAVETRKSCTSHGIGVVRRENYSCMQTALDRLNPPYKEASLEIIRTLLPDNEAFPMYQCTYFVQMVTAAVCNVPIAPPDTAWQDYPLAKTFINKQISGYQWMSKAQGTPQIGDVLFYDGQGESPGHIMIVAEAIDSSRFRIAEANQLKSDGTEATVEDTGVTSNTRIELANDTRIVGWYRLTSRPQASSTQPTACDNPCSLYGMYEGECRSDRNGSYLCKNACSIVVNSCR